MKPTKKTFGKYEVRINQKGMVSVYYVWSENDKELFKDNLTAVDAMLWMRDGYIRKGNPMYDKVKAFLWPYVEAEF